MENNKKHLAAYDLLRIAACLTVILHHYINAVYGNVTDPLEQKILLLLDNLFMVNNGLFFMMSGKFALEKCRDDLKGYYYNKIIKVIVPMLLLSAGLYLVNHKGPVGFGTAVSFYKAFMGNEIVSYLWFMYTLIGFYLVAPFFAVMMKALNEQEKLALTAVIAGVIVVLNVSEIAGISVELGEYPFAENYIAFCFLGYLVDNTEFFGKHARVFLGIGAMALAVSTAEIAFFPGWNPSIYGFCITRVMMCWGLYVFITRYSERYCRRFQKLLAYISRHTYYIYLMHGTAQGIIWGFLTKESFSGAGLAAAVILGSAGIFLLSLAAAVVFRLVYEDFLLKKCMRRI